MVQEKSSEIKTWICILSIEWLHLLFPQINLEQLTVRHILVKSLNFKNERTLWVSRQKKSEGKEIQVGIKFIVINNQTKKGMQNPINFLQLEGRGKHFIQGQAVL